MFVIYGPLHHSNVETLNKSSEACNVAPATNFAQMFRLTVNKRRKYLKIRQDTAYPT